MLNRSKLLAFGLLSGVFVAGGVVGGAARAGLANRPEKDRGRQERSDRAPRERRSYTDRLAGELQLTPIQRDSLEHILATYQDAMDALWAEVRPRMQTIRTEVRGEIRAMLDETQQERFTAHLARVDSARAARDRDGRRGSRNR